MKLTLALSGLLLASLPAVAQASGGTPVSEASSTLLFALGTLGVLIGRRVSSRRPAKQRPHNKD